MHAFEYLALGTGLVGAAVVAWGALLTLVELVRLEAARFGGRDICRTREEARHHFGSYLLMGLEFLVAADVIRTVNRPSLREVGILGAIVGIRTVLNLFLNRELRYHECGAEGTAQTPPEAG